MKFILLFSAYIFFFVACSNNNPVIISQEELVKFTAAEPGVAAFKDELNEFYRGRNYQAAWTLSKGLNSKGKALLEKLNNETADSADHSSLDKVNGLYAAKRKKLRFRNDSISSEMDMLLTSAFFEYASHNWQGINDRKVKQTGWLIKRRSVNMVSILDSLVKMDGEDIIAFQPVYRQYALLNDYLDIYHKLAESGEYPVNSNADVSMIKKQLFLLGDLKQEEKNNSVSPGYVEAIKSFQQRNGLEVTGKADNETIGALNVPLNRRIEQLLINMERCRWFPEHLKGDNVVVNIPAYELYVIKDDSLQWKCDVVVGTDSTSTVIFNDVMEYIVFSPYWYLPESIIKKETIPAMLKDENYLASHNMEVVDKNGEPLDPDKIDLDPDAEINYQIRQKPGGNNSLGHVKFLLPNNHNIYLHDTPAKSLFNENDRSFSHGCVRVSEPVKLAQYILRDEKKWDEKSIREAMNSDKEIMVKLKTKIPVYLTYFTAWVDNGKLNFRNDIYGLDDKMRNIALQE